FVALAGIAERLYAPFIPDHLAPTLVIHLVTRATRAEDLKIKTVFPDTDSAAERRASIIADLPTDTFGDAHLRELPYYMFHEISRLFPLGVPPGGDLSIGMPARAGPDRYAAHARIRKSLGEMTRKLSDTSSQ